MDIQRKQLLISGTAGLIDPWLNKLARELASRVPHKSALRSVYAELALGVVKGFVEAFSANRGISLSVLAEKVTDFGDFFSGALGVTTYESKQLFYDWNETFFAEAIKRFSNAKLSEDELKLIKSELELRKVFIQSIQSKEGKRNMLTEPLAEVVRQTTLSLRELNKRLESRLQKKNFKNTL